MALDLVHIDREIQKKEAEITQARGIAATLFGVVGGPQTDEAINSPDVSNVEAARQEARARELEEERDGLIAEKQRLEAELADLEHQKTQLTIDYEANLERLTNDIARVRGSSAML